MRVELIGGPADGRVIENLRVGEIEVRVPVVSVADILAAPPVPDDLVTFEVDRYIYDPRASVLASRPCMRFVYAGRA